MLIDVAISGNGSVTNKEAENILKCERPDNRNTDHVECKSNCDTSDNRGNWNCLKVTQKILEKHNGTA
jgi:hypothetical protein